VAIKFKDNAADIVKTVDRAGLMTNRFKDLSLRTKDDLEDMFGQREGLFTICNKAKDCKEREEREMSDLSELTSELMQDKEFRKEYEDLQPEINIMRAMMDARIRAGMTQMELSQKSGISQADISRLENGTRNPSIALLKRLADAMDTTLIIEFVPKKMEI
jgi:ribosome-binding protein aMBF1 (putative translation factor)